MYCRATHILASEHFRSVRKGTEAFGNVRNGENNYFVWMHTLLLHGSMVVMSDDNTFHHQNAQQAASEMFGTMRKHSEEVGTVPNLAEELERVEKYSLTVREVARMFDEAGVPRTERSITKWCTPNSHGVPRLTCQFG